MGIRFDTVTYSLSCPEGKWAVMEVDLNALESDLETHATVDRAACETMAGRAGNLAQVFPEWRSALYPLYTISKVRRKASRAQQKGRGRPPLLRRAPIRRGGRWHRELQAFIDIARASLQADEGVHLAPSARFPALGSEGVAVSVTDASGDDGVGGYLFHPAAPGEVWLVSESWPADVAAALAAAATPRMGRDPEAQMLAMPAAELFGVWAVPLAVQEWRDAEGRAVPTWDAITAIGDCAPAARALNLEASGSAQMRVLLQAAGRTTQHWLGVAVPREWNLDADRLSHPTMYEEVD